MQRELFIKRPLPYYIQAPNYRRSSSGIRVMHMLCDALNRSGQEAYIVADVLNPQLMTPRLTLDVVELHRNQGLQPIAIYPEIIDGNPLNASTVVRYILNQPGFVEGRGKYEDDDILFSYTKPLLLPGMAEDRVLYLPAPDLSVFCPPTDPAKRVPGKVCYYQGRRGQAKVDPALLPADAVEITAQWPATWEELADLFQQCEFFYCTEASALGGEAALCGCLAVILPNEWAPLKLEPTAYGVAWSLEPEEIERAKSTNHLLRDRLLKAQVDFWPALDHFIEVTQAAAQERAATASKRTLQAWLAERVLSDGQRQLAVERLAGAGRQTLGVVVNGVGIKASSLMTTLKSLTAQTNVYQDIRIIALSDEAVSGTVASDRLHFVHCQAEQVLPTIERVVRESAVDWFMLVEAGSEFTASGLTVAGLDLQGASGCRAVYADEALRKSNGDMGAVMRPDPNLDLLLSLPSAMARHWLFNRSVWLAMGGFRQEAGRAFELDYILRLIEDKGFEGFGHISEPLLIRTTSTLQDCPDEREVIERHLRARGFPDAKVASTRPGHYDLDYGVCVEPGVSILVYTQGSLAKTRRCMETILEKTAYRNYEVLLLDQGAEPALQTWLTGVEQLATDAVRLLRFPRECTVAQLQNQAAEHAKGEFLLWLDAGAAVLDGQWLHQLVNHAARAEVGAVGAKLVDGERKVLHAGLVLGLNGSVDRAFAGQPMEASGYLQRLSVDQNYTALSGKCLMLRKDVFKELGGFEESPELQRWIDVDLCLRLHAAGFLNVWTPRAQLLLTEDTATPVTKDDEEALYSRWLPLLARDPAYNPNFSLVADGGFVLAPSQLSWQPLASWKPLPTIIAHPADRHGCGHYRVIQPFEAMRREGLAEGYLGDTLLTIPEIERYAPDTIVLQRQISDDQIDHIRRMKAFSRAFKVYDLDDYLPNLPLKSVHRAHMPKDILRSLRRALAHVDRFIVSTAPLAEAFAGLHGDIRIARNTLDPLWWGSLTSQRRRGAKPRVGWAGGAGHTGDLEMIADVVKELANEVDWVFFGLCPDKLRPYVQEVHSGVPIEQYPAALARLDLDLALAPVEQNLFNECKSNLRLLEYGACGFPVVCSDVICYRDDSLPVTRVKNRFRDWVEAIRMHLADLDATARQGDELRRIVLSDWMLTGDNLQHWREVWLPG